MILKLLATAIFASAALGAVAQQSDDIAMRTPNMEFEYVTGNNLTTANSVEFKYTLDAYSDNSAVKLVFEEEHFIGGELSQKWSLFQQNYKRVYEQTIGLSGSTVEILKPIIFNAVNKINGYYKKTVRKGEVSTDEAAKVLNHVFDCANLACFESETQGIENEIKTAKTINEMVRVFDSIHINYHYNKQ